MKIDAHVHMVGNGLKGKGSFLKIKSPIQRILASLMLKQLGLRQRDLYQSDLESLYLNLILKWTQESSVDKVVLLAQEQVYEENGTARPDLSSMYIPNDMGLGIAKNNHQILPAVSIHPARVDALDELARCKELGAVMLKCLPLYQCIDCNNPKYSQFWQRMADLNLPLLAHTGGENALPVYRKELAAPNCLRLPLECGVNVIAAHAAATYNTWISDHRPTIKKMLREYPNLYVDNSGLHVPFRALYFKQFFLEEFQGRIIHGSDLPVPVMGIWPFLHGLISSSDYKKIRKLTNPIERDIAIKKAIGFSDDCLTQLSKLL